MPAADRVKTTGTPVMERLARAHVYTSGLDGSAEIVGVETCPWNLLRPQLR